MLPSPHAYVLVLPSLCTAPDANVEEFITAVADLVDRNTGLPAKDFELMRFGMDLFTVQRDHGLYAASEFLFPLLSLLVIEGKVRGLDPDIDFQTPARPMRPAAGLAYLRRPGRWSPGIG